MPSAPWGTGSPAAHENRKKWQNLWMNRPRNRKCQSMIRIGPWTDVFLLGATLYVLLTGSCPFDAPTAEEAFARAGCLVVSNTKS